MPRAGLDARVLTEAAAIVVDTHGPAALTLARVAIDVGVAPPSLYKHVASLDDLLVRVTTLAIGRLADRLTTAAIGRSGRHALVAIAEAYRCFALAHPGLYSLTQAALTPGSSAQRVESTRAVSIFIAVVEGYGVPNPLAVHAVRMLRAALHGFIDIEIRGGFQLPNSVNESFLLLIDALDASLDGFGERAGSGK